MRQVRFLLMMALLLASGASAQTLECPSSGSRSSEPFHFHIQMYRPDTRGFLDVWGINDFASQAACDHAREASMKRNLAVVEYFKTVRGENQYEPDRFGTCHADMSIDKANPRYLTDAQRVSQVRAAEDVRQRVRERLLGANMTTDNEIYRDVGPPVAVPPAQISGPRFVPLPPAGIAQTVYSTADLKTTKAIDTTKPAIASLDQPLVDPVPVAGAAMAAPAARPVQAAAAPQPAAPTPPPAEPRGAEPASSTQTSHTAVAAPAPAAEPPVAMASAPAPAVPPPAVPAAAAPAAEPAQGPGASGASAPIDSAEDVADTFVAYETQRIQNVIKASSVIADESVKSKIYDACMQRSQLLSNLRALIEVSGAKSRLAANARIARSEDERLTFVSKLFGDEIRSHWAPKDATDVILEPQPAVDDDVVGVLRSATNKFSDQQKRRALYILLARGQPTEDQQLWLTTIADTFLQ